MSKVVLVLPAYNASKTLEYTISSIPPNIIDEMILVDDGSEDETVEIAEGLGIYTICHHHNAGYGANQKTCYTIALKKDADIVIMLHPDGQYDPSIIPNLITPLIDNDTDVVLGSRFMDPKGPIKGGMPYYKYLSNKFLTYIENLVLGIKLSEYHTGYRAYNRNVLETLPFIRNSNDFIFDQQFLFQVVHFGFKIKEIPVSTKYFQEASSINFLRSVKYGLSTIALSIVYILHRIGIRSKLFTK